MNELAKSGTGKGLFVTIAAAVVVLALIVAAVTLAPQHAGKRDASMDNGSAATTGAKPASEARRPPKPASRAPARPDTSATAKWNATGPLFFEEAFSGDTLDETRWVKTRKGEFREAAIRIVEGRLCLRAGTIGIPAAMVSSLGLRTAAPVVDLTKPVDVAFEIDWNNQANGCYLQARVLLCPTVTDATAEDEPDWLQFAYVGVPPGKNARAVLVRRAAGRYPRYLHTEGWPKEQRTGRAIGRQKIVLRLDQQNVAVLENGQCWWGPKPHGLAFRRAYLYIEIESHSNYPPREIFFGDISVRATAR